MLSIILSFHGFSHGQKKAFEVMSKPGLSIRDSLCFALYEFPQNSPLIHKLVIGSHFNDFARLHDCNLIIVFNDIEAVNHGNQGTFIFPLGFEQILYARLGLVVESGSRFVHN